MNSEFQPSLVAEARKTTPSKPGDLDLEWVSGLSQDEWENYMRAIRGLKARNVPFVLGGGFAQAAFTGRWRNTKDIDFYVLPRDVPVAKEALSEAGFEDYFTKVPYDRAWIYRSTRADVIVDIIWAMANQRAQVDSLFLERATPVSLRGEELMLIPMEDFLWCKMYVIQRDRCDWADVINVLYSNAPRLDWEHFLWRLGPDRPLLHAVLAVYGWLHPERALQVPDWVRKSLNLPLPNAADADLWPQRARFLDSRIWFTALKPRGERLEI